MKIVLRFNFAGSNTLFDATKNLIASKLSDCDLYAGLDTFIITCYDRDIDISFLLPSQYLTSCEITRLG
jgi:hypothetical protein